MSKQKRDGDTVFKVRLLRIMAIYAIFSLTVLILSITLFKKMEKSELYIEVNETVTETQYVYVRADTQVADDSTTESIEDPIYTVREHMDKIGIFAEDGSLVGVLDVYVKTLPEADKRLLGEGFEVVGKSALNAIIEDYCS